MWKLFSLVLTLTLAGCLTANELGRKNFNQQQRRDFRHLPCKELTNDQFKSALCTRWPARGSISNEVVVLIVHMADLNRIDSPMISSLGLSLRSLHMTKCNIKQLDVDTLSSVRSLEEIDLSENELQSMPPRFFERTPNIQKIILRNNALDTLDPNAFARLQYLTYLDLSGNRLAFIPAALPAYITHLYLADNQISKLSAQLPRLQHLDLCHNSLSSFSLSDLGSPRLVSLCLSDSYSLQQVSDQCEGLQKLVLKGLDRRIASLSVLREPLSNFTSGCGQLRSLKIQKHELSSLEILDRMTLLESLVLNEVVVKVKPTVESFNHLTNLRSMDLSRSGILAHHMLKNGDILASLSQITSLTLQDCGLKHMDWMPSHVTAITPHALSSLSEVDLAGNKLECHNDHVKRILCSVDTSTSAMVNDAGAGFGGKTVKLKNVDRTLCHDPENPHTKKTLSQMDFSYCAELVRPPVVEESRDARRNGDKAVHIIGRTVFNVMQLFSKVFM